MNQITVLRWLQTNGSYLENKQSMVGSFDTKKGRTELNLRVVAKWLPKKRPNGVHINTKMAGGSHI